MLLKGFVKHKTSLEVGVSLKSSCIPRFVYNTPGGLTFAIVNCLMLRTACFVFVCVYL